MFCMLDKNNYKKDRTVCKIGYNRKKGKNKSNTSHHNQESKVLITITITIELQTSSDEVLELLEFIQCRFLRGTRT